MTRFLTRFFDPFSLTGWVSPCFLWPVFWPLFWPVLVTARCTSHKSSSLAELFRSSVPCSPTIRACCNGLGWRSDQMRRMDAKVLGVCSNWDVTNCKSGTWIPMKERGFGKMKTSSAMGPIHWMSVLAPRQGFQDHPRKKDRWQRRQRIGWNAANCTPACNVNTLTIVCLMFVDPSACLSAIVAENVCAFSLLSS